MTTLKELAQAYEPPQTTRNIVELDQLKVDVEIKTETGTKKDGTEFSYNYIEVDGDKYRVPNSVLKQLKVQLEANRSLTSFKVVKKGTGMETDYTVIPLASGSEPVV